MLPRASTGTLPGIFERMLDAEAVNVLQADATRCGGISGFLDAARSVGGTMFRFLLTAVPACIFTFAVPFHVPFTWNFSTITRGSSACSLTDFANRAGCMWPDLIPPRVGLELKEKDASRFRV